MKRNSFFPLISYYRYTGQFHSHYSLKEAEALTDYYSKLSLSVVSLNHLEDVPEDKRGNNSLYQWGRVFKATSWLVKLWS